MKVADVFYAEEKKDGTYIVKNNILELLNDDEVSKRILTCSVIEDKVYRKDYFEISIKENKDGSPKS